MEKSKYILIDSKYKTTGDPSNLRIYFNEQITIKNYIKINYLSMPRMNYLINSNNNLIIISFIANVGVQAYNIILNMQNYTPLSLTAYINSMLSNINNFNCIYNTNTFKIEFTANCPFNIDFSKSNFYKLVSLNNIIYNSSIKNNNNFFSTGIINFNQPYYLNININNIPNNVMIGNDQYNQFNFIIPVVDTNFGDILNYNNINYDIKMFVENFKCNYFDIIVNDDYNNKFNNNGIDWFMALEYY